MAEIEIGAATLDEFPQIAKMDLSFESEYVWKTQMLEGLGSIEASFQRIRLPKTIRVSFQAYSTANMEMLIRQHQILSVRYEAKVIGSGRCCWSGSARSPGTTTSAVWSVWSRQRMIRRSIS